MITCWFIRKLHIRKLHRSTSLITLYWSISAIISWLTRVSRKSKTAWVLSSRRETFRLLFLQNFQKPFGWPLSTQSSKKYTLEWYKWIRHWKKPKTRTPIWPTAKLAFCGRLIIRPINTTRYFRQSKNLQCSFFPSALLDRSIR